jgi:hypothetical protein
MPKRVRIGAKKQRREPKQKDQSDSAAKRYVTRARDCVKQMNQSVFGGDEVKRQRGDARKGRKTESNVKTNQGQNQRNKVSKQIQVQTKAKARANKSQQAMQ